MGGDNVGGKGKCYKGTCVKDTWTKLKGGRIQDGRQECVRWGEVVGRKWRQLYLNNNKNVIKNRNNYFKGEFLYIYVYIYDNLKILRDESRLRGSTKRIETKQKPRHNMLENLL